MPDDGDPGPGSAGPAGAGNRHAGGTDGDGAPEAAGAPTVDPPPSGRSGPGTDWGDTLGERLAIALALTVLAFTLGPGLAEVRPPLVPGAGDLAYLLLVQDLGFLAVAAAFVATTRLTLGRIGLRRLPDRRVLGSVLALAAGLVGLAVLVVTILAASGEPGVPTLGDAERAAIAPLLLALIPLSVLLVAPAEELFFRGILQSYLRERTTGGRAAAWAALLFALVHVPQYQRAYSGGSLLLVVGVVFAVGLAAGRVYERTGSLLAPIALHAAYNSALAGIYYLEVTRGVLPV